MLSTQSLNNTAKYEHKCNCCTGTCVDLTSCSKFKSMSLDDRYKLVRMLKLCYNCLKGKHFANNCRKPKACTVSDCYVKHNILLHSWSKPGFDHAATQPSVKCAATKGSMIKNCLGIIPVLVKGRNGNSCKTFALLDDGADKTLCNERLRQKLNIASKPVTFEMSTVSSSGSTIHGQEKAIDGNDNVSLEKVWSVKKLPISARSATENVDIRKLPYSADIQIPSTDLTEVMLLIGTDSPNAHIPLEVRSGNENQPYAIRSRLGWAIRGPIEDTHASNVINVHFEEARDVLLQRQLERMWTSDFDDRAREDKNGLSIENKEAMKMMESSITQADGHYKLGLPWRDRETTLPDNMVLAHARLQQLKRKLSSNETLHKMYTTTVNDYIEKGYAKEVTNIESKSKRLWYLPHHPITNENKPGKVRVVFDCASKYQGISLNSQLLQGPDLMNSLVGVIIRFRQDKVALAADIEAMYHQVRVREDDCDALRFLWWPNGNLDQKPKIYCMNVHLFGATSSPSCTAYVLKRTARDYAHLFDQEVALTVERNFYVDDCLKSVSSEQQAIKLATDLQSMMKMGGFRLTKWLSNRRNVLNAIPESERASSVVSLGPSDMLPSDKALGVIWDVNEDKIKFKVKLSDKPLTRRGILSIVSSIFDPLGLVSSVTLRAKAIVQHLCKEKFGWDEQIPQEYHDKWKSWVKNLPCLENLSVNRCFLPRDVQHVKNVQLHLFSDGSELGYGACAYLRGVDENDRTTCSLMMGKARLAPIKQVSIPRT
ncbi:unnamed protein product [Mytilus coruscus]|uniref:Peptidase A2 domain-containing protein n=1 Tax=Mytilus coruscus TaxID=42192 RepID=A0A6J8A6D0_MYTCO|nr:unnamed protein product [Mytilus coruscus]